jgi:Xaa-Pro aminopeptidase
MTAPGTGLMFSREEYGARLDHLQTVLSAASIDVALIDRTEYLVYLVGWGPEETLYRACLAPASGEPVMVLRSLDTAPFLEQTWFADYVAVSDSDDMLDALIATVRERGWAGGRIGFDARSYNMNLSRFRRLEAALPDAVFVDLADDLEAMRWCKSPAEIDYLRHAATIADAAMLEAIAAGGEGRTERDAAAAASAAFVRLGADNGMCGPVTAGSGWNFLHGHTHDRPMARGDVLHMELVPTVNRYSARLMRNAIIGGPTPEHAAIAEQLIAVQDAQIATMASGAAAAEVDRVGRAGIIDAGLRDDYDNVTGYTLGIYPLGTPVLSDFSRCFLPEADWALESGMVFHMYMSARGLAISETVVVGDDGPERLTQLPRQLYSA